MKSLVEALIVGHNSIQSIIADEPVAIIEAKSSRATTAPAGLTCLGVTIVKESKLSKLQENQPILLSTSNSESDSLLNEIVLNVQKVKLVDNVFPGKASFKCNFLLILCRGVCCEILSKLETFEK